MVNVIFFIAQLGTTVLRVDAEDVIIVPPVDTHLRVARFPKRSNIASRVNPESIKRTRAKRFARNVRRASTKIFGASRLVRYVHRGNTSYLPRKLVRTVPLARRKKKENAKNACQITFLLKVPLPAINVPSGSFRIMEKPVAVIALLVNILAKVHARKRGIACHVRRASTKQMWVGRLA